MWDLDAGGFAPCLKVSDHSDSVTCLAFNASSTLLASGDMAGRIILTDMESRSERCRVCATRTTVLSHWPQTTSPILDRRGRGEGVVAVALDSRHSICWHGGWVDLDVANRGRRNFPEQGWNVQCNNSLITSRRFIDILDQFIVCLRGWRTTWGLQTASGGLWRRKYSSVGLEEGNFNNDCFHITLLLLIRAP